MLPTSLEITRRFLYVSLAANCLIGQSLGPAVNIGGSSASGGAQDLQFNYYIDSISGSDGNTGQCTVTQAASLSWSACAFKTTAAALTVLSGKGGNQKVCLSYGSYFQNQHLNVAQSLSLTDATRITIAACGDPSNGLPVVDAAQIISTPGTLGSWSADGSGAYSISVTTPSTGIEPSGFSAFENAGSAYAFLTPVTSQALCDSTVGSYYIANLTAWPGGTATLYVHPTSGSPLANGFSYKITSQIYAINTWVASGVSINYTYPVISNIITCCQAGNNGSLVLGAGGIATGGQANFGGKHNLLAASQTTVSNYSMTAGNCRLGCSLFIQYDNYTAGSGENYSNIVADGAGSVAGQVNPAYDSHFGGGPGFGPVQLSNWTIRNVYGGLSGQWPYSASFITCAATVNVCLEPSFTATYSNITAASTQRDLSISSGGFSVTVTNSTLGSAGGLSIFSGNVSVTNSTFTLAGMYLASGATGTSTGNSFLAAGYTDVCSACTLTSNNNQFYGFSSSNPGSFHGVLQTRANWLGLGFDANSVFH